MKKFILYLTIIFLSSISKSYASAGWSGNAKITSFYLLNEGRAIVKLSNFSNTPNCLVNYGGDVTLNPTTNKIWFSVLWSSFLANKKVNIYVTGTCTDIWSGTSYAEIGHVRVYQD